MDEMRLKISKKFPTAEIIIFAKSPAIKSGSPV